VFALYVHTNTGKNNANNILLSYRWKEPIAYYFTPGSVQGAVLGEIVDEICKEAAKVGLHVLAETNDMGTPNLAAWT
jgi:hypothetical protein